MNSNFDDPCTRMQPGDWYQFEVWRRSDHVVGTQRQDFENEQLERFPVLWRFMTTYGGFIIVSNDKVITRQHAINFAKAFALGKVVHCRIDLKPVSR